VTAYNARIVRLCQQIKPCQRLSQGAGVGPLTATAFYATVGNAQAFDNGRHVSAWLGLVPKQHASGERNRAAKPGPLNLSNFVVDRSWCICICVCLHTASLFYAIGSKTARRCTAPQPVLTRYTLLEVERPRLGMTSRVTPVRGRDVYQTGHASGVCDHCQDLITAIMEPMACAPQCNPNVV
jgi:hypothetical protein